MFHNITIILLSLLLLPFYRHYTRQLL